MLFLHFRHDSTKFQKWLEKIGITTHKSGCVLIISLSSLLISQLVSTSTRVSLTPLRARVEVKTKNRRAKSICHLIIAQNSSAILVNFLTILINWIKMAIRFTQILINRSVKLIHRLIIVQSTPHLLVRFMIIVQITSKVLVWFLHIALCCSKITIFLSVILINCTLLEI